MAEYCTPILCLNGITAASDRLRVSIQEIHTFSKVYIFNWNSLQTNSHHFIPNHFDRQSHHFQSLFSFSFRRSLHFYHVKSISNFLQSFKVLINYFFEKSTNMLAQTILFPILTLAASTFASPITPASELAARGKFHYYPNMKEDNLHLLTISSDANLRCQQGLFIAAPPKEFLYQVQCNTAFSLDQTDGISGRLDSFHAFDLIDCAL